MYYKIIHYYIKKLYKFLLSFVYFFQIKYIISIEINKSGHPFSEVWDGHMIKGAQITRRHYSVTCSYCHTNWKHGKSYVLHKHLTNHCKNVLKMFLYFLQK